MSSNDQHFDSTYKRRATLEGLIADGVVDQRVLAQLMVNGTPVPDEAVLWDFKLKFPLPAKSGKMTDDDQLKYDCELAEIVKDVVAFHNSYGGYLIGGVDDKTKNVVGFAGVFDAAELNKKVQAVTGASIETVFRSITFSVQGNEVTFGLLFIPKRPYEAKPVQIRKASPQTKTGKKAYAKDAFYLRERDSCRSAETVDDYEFLFGSGRRQWTGIIAKAKHIDNSLPARDPDLGTLLGREEEVSSLWQWLIDAFSPVRIICGLGGLGKTSIAYTFAERVIYQAPPYIDKVVWLGAKHKTFSAPANDLRVTSRVDFRNIPSLFINLLSEVGCPVDQIPDDPSINELLGLAEQHLKEFAYLIIVDDVDTLENEEQQQLFHYLTQIASSTKSKVLLTARRNLGASRSVYFEVQGLSPESFEAFVAEKATLHKVSIPFDKHPTDRKSLYEASGGSPLFGLSILRLVSLGDSLKDAIKNWRGFDGEKVRDAAFRREVMRLKASEARALLAMCYLGKASVVELSAILEMSRYEIQEAIAELQAFSMTTIGTALPGGATFEVPNALLLMSSLIEQRVGDWQVIKVRCQKFVEANQNQGSVVAEAVSRALAFLSNSDPDNAVVAVRSALEQLPENADLYCLLGRCYGELDRRFDDEAEQAFQRSLELGCNKRELFVYWIKVRERREDWRGVIELALKALKLHQSPLFFSSANRARMQIGDMYGRGGRYDDAVTIYAEAIEELRSAINLPYVGGARSSLRQLKEALVFRWLGAVKAAESNNPSRSPRIFGAYAKACVSYGLSDLGAFVAALQALEAWLTRVLGRRLVSETAALQLSRERERLLRLSRHLERRPESVDTRRKDVEAMIARLLAQIEATLPGRLIAGPRGDEA